jgi:hypothetical protein
MAEPLTPEQAREQFRKVTHGQRIRQSLSIEEAKARLREVDAELEISPAIDYLNRRQWRNALLYLVYWTSTPTGRAALAPVLLRLLSIASLLLGLVHRIFVSKSRPQSDAESKTGSADNESPTSGSS